MIYRSHNETHDTTLITTGRVGELSLNITCHGLLCCKCLPTGLLWRHHLCRPHRETKDCAAPPKVCFDGILSDAKWNFVPVFANASQQNFVTLRIPSPSLPKGAGVYRGEDVDANVRAGWCPLQMYACACVQVNCTHTPCIRTSASMEPYERTKAEGRAPWKEERCGKRQGRQRRVPEAEEASQSVGL
ncbi:hypothetical protein ALC57_06703 [Trachymyrmex cornetzi]|uniref:Uncharacterized protein n=1 Tax=Trachymyrmex cornetzi TaxID=471704 RepID=A0A195E7G3_9HYME|nr:hypothetical protein ALC57_06703 [Trachymyrmex cornetzi]